MARRQRSPLSQIASAVPQAEIASVSWSEQLRRAAWMSLFPPIVGLAYVVITTWGVRGRLGPALLWIVPAELVFFTLLAGASLAASRWKGPQLALRTRTVCPACRREIAVVATRCPACDAAVPVSRAAFPTFAYTAVAYAAFQLVLLLGMHA